LSPYAGTVVVCATATYVEGAADRFLGILAGTAGWFDRAVHHLEDASAVETRLGSGPLLAQSQYWLARMLRLRHNAGDEERASALLNESFTTAHRLKMDALERLVASLTTPA